MVLLSPWLPSLPVVLLLFKIIDAFQMHISQVLYRCHFHCVSISSITIGVPWEWFVLYRCHTMQEYMKTEYKVKLATCFQIVIGQCGCWIHIYFCDRSSHCMDLIKSTLITHWFVWSDTDWNYKYMYLNTLNDYVLFNNIHCCI